MSLIGVGSSSMYTALIFLIISIISGQKFIEDPNTYSYFVLQIITLSVSIGILVGELRERRRN
jgi:hypothetical protein